MRKVIVLDELYWLNRLKHFTSNINIFKYIFDQFHLVRVISLGSVLLKTKQSGRTLS